MNRAKIVKLSAAAIAAGLSLGSQAIDQQPATDTQKHPKKMKMDEPMPTGMAKEGMMKGDVKSSADKKAKAMQPMMEQEEKAMPVQDKAKP